MMFFLHMNCFFVTWQVIVPLVFKSGQKLHWVLAMHLFFSRFGCATAWRDLLLIGVSIGALLTFEVEELVCRWLGGMLSLLIKSVIEL